MITINNTSRYPDAEVKRLVRFALADSELTHVHVNVKNSKHPRRGAAYGRVPSISNAPRSARSLITVGIGAPHHFPHENGYWNSKARKEGKGRRGGKWPEITLRDWREALVYCAAHEAKHIECSRERKRQSELACEHHGAWVLDRFREQELASREPE